MQLKLSTLSFLAWVLPLAGAWEVISYRGSDCSGLTLQTTHARVGDACEENGVHPEARSILVREEEGDNIANAPGCDGT